MESVIVRTQYVYLIYEDYRVKFHFSLSNYVLSKRGWLFMTLYKRRYIDYDTVLFWRSESQEA